MACLLINWLVHWTENSSLGTHSLSLTHSCSFRLSRKRIRYVHIRIFVFTWVEATESMNFSLSENSRVLNAQRLVRYSLLFFLTVRPLRTWRTKCQLPCRAMPLHLIQLIIIYKWHEFIIFTSHDWIFMYIYKKKYTHRETKCRRSIEGERIFVKFYLVPVFINQS